VLTKRSEDHNAVQVHKAGADGYLYKSESAETVLDSKDRKGRKYAPNELAETGHFCNEWTEWTRRLSHREYQVVSLFPSGMGMSEIAQRLFLSVMTVSTYVPFARETECPEQCATDALCLQQRHSRVKHNFR